jgi:hypothetical protein
VNNQLDFMDLDNKKTLNLPLVNKRTSMQKYDMVILIEFMNISYLIGFIVFK